MNKSILINGQIGSGKTRTAMTIANENGCEYVLLHNLDELDKYADGKTVVDFEGYGLSPAVFDKLPNKGKFDVVFIGYDKVTVKEIADQIKGHGQSRGYGDKITAEAAKSISAISKIIKAECDKLGYKFVDVDPKGIKYPHSTVADETWEVLFHEKKHLDLSKVGTKFDGRTKYGK